MQGTDGAATADLAWCLILFLWIRSDHLTDNDAPEFFLHINARKQGLPLEFCITLGQSLPKGSPLLPERCCQAMIENRVPAQTMEMVTTARNMYWNTYDIKNETEKLTTR